MKRCNAFTGSLDMNQDDNPIEQSDLRKKQVYSAASHVRFPSLPPGRPARPVLKQNTKHAGVGDSRTCITLIMDTQWAMEDARANDRDEAAEKGLSGMLRYVYKVKYSIGMTTCRNISQRARPTTAAWRYPGATMEPEPVATASGETACSYPRSGSAGLDRR